MILEKHNQTVKKQCRKKMGDHVDLSLNIWWHKKLSTSFCFFLAPLNCTSHIRSNISNLFDEFLKKVKRKKTENIQRETERRESLFYLGIGGLKSTGLEKASHWETVLSSKVSRGIVYQITDI